MKRINENTIRAQIRDFLFENHLNEKYQPEDGHYIDFNKDVPGPMINGDNTYDPSFVEEEVPILPSDIMTDPSYNMIIHDVEDDNYCPTNETEFKTAILSLIEKCDDLESQDKIQSVWSSFKKILVKVCENE